MGHPIYLITKQRVQMCNIFKESLSWKKEIKYTYKNAFIPVSWKISQSTKMWFLIKKIIHFFPLHEYHSIRISKLILKNILKICYVWVRTFALKCYECMLQKQPMEMICSAAARKLKLHMLPDNNVWRLLDKVFLFISMAFSEFFLQNTSKFY